MSSFDAITIQRATVHHADGILDCLRSAFAPYQHNYSATAYEDTVLTPESLLHRLDEMAVFVALNTYGRVVGTIACNV